MELWRELCRSTPSGSSFRVCWPASSFTFPATTPKSGRSAGSALIKGNLDAAEDYFEAKSKAELTSGGSSYEVAEALHLKAALQSLRDQAGAIDACLRAVNRNPAEPPGWSRLGHLYLPAGKLTEAQTAFQKTVVV